QGVDEPRALSPPRPLGDPRLRGPLNPLCRSSGESDFRRLSVFEGALRVVLWRASSLGPGEHPIQTRPRKLSERSRFRDRTAGALEQHPKIPCVKRFERALLGLVVGLRESGFVTLGPEIPATKEQLRRGRV